MRWARVLIILLMVLRWVLTGTADVNIGRCRRLAISVSPAFVCPPISHLVKKISSMWFNFDKECE